MRKRNKKHLWKFQNVKKEEVKIKLKTCYSVGLKKDSKHRVYAERNS